MALASSPRFRGERISSLLGLDLTSTLAPGLFRVDRKWTVNLDAIAFTDESIALASLTKNADGGTTPKIVIDRYAPMLQLCSRRGEHKFYGRSLSNL